MQGLRAIAVLLVVAYHAGAPVHGGFLGVDVFFVVSGFLITKLLQQELERTGRIDLRSFFARRIRRLLPALAVMTTVTVVASHFLLELGRPLRNVARTGVAASLFGANFQLYRATDYFAPAAERNPLLHTWSLSVEEQFYLVLPFLLIAAFRLGRATTRDRRVSASVSLGIAGSLALAALLVDTRFDAGLLAPIGNASRFAFFAPVTRAWEFLAGSLLAVGLRWTRTAGPRWVASLTGNVGLALVLGSALVLDSNAPVPGPATVPVVLGTIMLVWAGGHSATGFLQRALRSSGMNWIGDRSYGLYLWHWPLLVLAGTLRPGSVVVTVAMVLLSGVLAEASYRLIETPLRSGATAGRRQSTLFIGLAAVVLPAAMSLGVLTLSDPNGTLEPSAADEACRPVSGWPEGCLIDDYGPTAPLFILAGDSHCASLAAGVIEAAALLGANVALQCRSATPIVSGPEDSRSGSSFLTLQNGIRILEPDAVIVSNRARRNLEEDAWGRWTDAEFADRTAAAAAWSTAVRDTAEGILLQSNAVIWVGPVPEFPDATSFGPSRLRPPRGASISFDELERQRGDVVRAELLALQDLDGVWQVDPATVLCAASCVNGDGRNSFYNDDHHLSATGSLMMRDVLASAMRAALARSG